MKSFNYYIELFNKYIEGLGYRKATIRSMIRGVSLLRDFLIEQKIYDVCLVSKDDIENYYNYLKTLKKRNGKSLANKTIAHQVSYVNQFFKYLLRHDLILINPCEEANIVVKTFAKRRAVFTQDEINLFLDSINIYNEFDLRERTIFELMYSSGLRVRELLNLKLNDINFADRQIRIIKGKGDKDRFVPFNEPAEKFLKKYRDKVRVESEKFVSIEYKEYLFLTRQGPLSPSQLNRRFKGFLKAVGLENKRLTMHSIRHSTATHLLEAGANIRYVQELLGHECLSTTVKYTYLMLDSLKKKYKMYHPRENEFFYEIDDKYLNELNNFRNHLLRSYEKMQYERKRLKRNMY